MGIPIIVPYALPTESELPPNQVPWQPEAARAVLLIHDMQRYFVDAFVPGRPPMTDVVDNIALLHRRCTELSVPVVYTAQPGGMTSAQRGLLHDFWGPGMGTEPRHREIIDELRPGERDTVLTKWRYSAFHRTELADLVRRRGRDQLLICGIYAHVGCLMTACESFSLDIQPFLIGDAVADFSVEQHQMALDYATARCGVALSTAGALRALAGDERQATRVPWPGKRPMVPAGDDEE